MSLPIINRYPTKSIKLPISKANVKYRAFLVGEEKNLVFLRESDGTTDAQFLEAMLDTTKACTFGAIDPRKLPLPDLELLFLRIRAISKGETSVLTYTCPGTYTKPGVDGAPDHSEPCRNSVEIGINLNTVAVTIPDNYTTSFAIPETSLVIHFKPATIEFLDKLEREVREGRVIGADASVFFYIENCVDKVTDGDQVYSDWTPAELTEFLASVPSSVFEAIRNDFVDATPTLEHDAPFKCFKCGHEETIPLRGYRSFF